MSEFFLKIKKEEVEGKILLTLSAFAVLFIILFENGDGHKSNLYLAFSFLFVMFSIFLWNRKEKKTLVLGGVLLYILLVVYWFGKI